MYCIIVISKKESFLYLGLALAEKGVYQHEICQ